MHDPQAKQKIAQKNQDPDADAVKTEKVAQSESILQAQFCNPAHSIDRVALAHPQRTNLIYGEQNWTVRESAKITRQIAELLLHLGVAAGERVALIARNTPYHLWIHAACARIGAIFVPISYRLQARELAQLLTICTPRVAVFDVETVSATYSDAITQLPKINSVFYLDADPQAPQCDTNLLERHKIHAFTAAYRDLPGKLLSVVKRKIAQIPAAKSQADPLLLSQIEYPTGLAAILFTSGSVGIPKAVGLTHAQLYWGNQNFRDGFEYSTVDRELVVAPLTHIGGFNGTTLDLFAHGGTVVVMREFDPEQLLTLLERHRVAMMFGVPTIYAAMLNHPKFAQFDLSNFRLPLIGGAVAAKASCNE
ncbi:AMP-binding protein [Arcanobacterium hippocoleae]